MATSSVPVDCGVQEIRVLHVVCSTVGYRVGEWMDMVGSSHIGLLGWCTNAVDGDQSVVELVKVGESSASVSGLQGFKCCQRDIHI